MKKAFTIILLLFISTLSFAQERNLGYKIMFGGHYTNLKQLNKKFTSLGLPPARSRLFSVGTGLAVQAKNYLFEVDLMYLNAIEDSKNENKDNRISTNGGNALITIGYEFPIRGHFYLYPIIGLSAGDINVKISEIIQSNQSFNSTVDNERNQLELTNSYLSQMVGGQALFHMGDYAITGLRFGFCFKPYSQHWNIDEIKVDNGPRINPAVFFFNLNYIFYLKEKY